MVEITGSQIMIAKLSSIEYTRLFQKLYLEDIGADENSYDIKTLHHKWFMNTRAKKYGGLRLTTEGVFFLEQVLKIPVFTFAYSEMPTINAYLIKFDRVMIVPWALFGAFNGVVHVPESRVSAEVHLYDGDILRYVDVKYEQFLLKNQK